MTGQFAMQTSTKTLIKFLVSFIVLSLLMLVLPSWQRVVFIGQNTSSAPPAVSATVVHWVSLSDTKATNALGTTVNRCSTQAFCFDLVEPSLSGNMLYNCVYYSDSPSSTPSWSDDKSNTWTLLTAIDDTTNGKKLQCAYVLNATTATYAIKVSFGAAVTHVGGFAAEYNNVNAIDVTASGISASGSSTMATTTTLTPTVTSDLVIQVGIRSQTPIVSSFTAGSGQSGITWKLQATDTLDGLVAQWGTYASTSSFNPQLTMASNSGYATMAVAFKTSTTGTARPAGMQVVGIQHNDVTDTIGATSPIALQFPCEGNLEVASMGFGMATGTSWRANAITDSNSNTWAATGVLLGNATTGQSQMMYAQNATCTSSMTVSVATLGTTDTTKDATIILYDVQGALTSNVFRQEAAISAHASGTGSSITLFDALAPGYSSGIAIYNLQEAQNTSQSLGGPCTNWDGQLFGGEGLSGGHPPDENNGWSHCLFTNTNQQAWSTGFASATSVGQYSHRVSFFGASGATKTALASETCTRANGGPLSNTVWTSFSYFGMKVASNQCVPNSLSLDDGNFYIGVAFPNDQWAQATIAAISGGSAGVDKGVGLALRASTTAHTEYRILVSNATGVNTWIEKFVAGTNTVLSTCTASPAWAAADVIYAEVQGTALKIKKNGTVISGCNVTDASIASGAPGFDYSSTMTTSGLTNWSAGDF